MSGLHTYCEAARQLVFGSELAACAQQRVATVQTLGGSGALKVGADFLKLFFPNARVWISNPSWDNHRMLFERAGFIVQTYPYYDERSGGLSWEQMRDALSRAATGDIVLIHACCHNPTGVDPQKDQWRELIGLLRDKQLLPFVDMAYQGFGAGLDEDAFAVREFARQGVPFLVANSFSKNFSLYGERCGALSVLCSDIEKTSRVFGQLTRAVRSNYSSPPSYGASIVAKILLTPSLRSLWEKELGEMRQRIIAMRSELFQRLSAELPHEDFSRYVNQRGMFTYTGLNADLVDKLRKEKGLYLVRSGRMCVSGVNSENVDVVVRALTEVYGSRENAHRGYRSLLT